MLLERRIPPCRLRDIDDDLNDLMLHILLEDKDILF